MGCSHSGREERTRDCYVTQGDRSDGGISIKVQYRVSGRGGGREANGPAVALWKPIQSASVIWVISALRLCGRRGNHQSYQMCKV